MAVVTPTPKTQFIDAAGEPLVGGKLYSYAAGTTTPQPTYTDSTGATANSNPVILDARGEANVWLGESTYKFKLTDANDVEIWTVDYISAPTTALSPVLSGNVVISSDSSGPALKITQTGTGYVMRVQDSVDPDSTPFVINSAGLVGLGTTAPAEALDIDDNGKIQFSSSGTALTVISADATNSTIDVKDARNFVLKTNGSTQLTVSSAGASTFAGSITVSSGGVAVTGNSSITGTFGVSSTLSVTGATTLVGNLTIQSSTSERTITLGSSGGYFYGNATQNGWKDSGGSAKIYWDTSGNFTAAANVTAYSDARLKKNVTTISNALELVNKMRGVYYDRVDTGEAGVGVIAQEMQTILPQVVKKNDDALSVAYGNIIGVLIEAIKELSDKLEARK